MPHRSRPLHADQSPTSLPAMSTTIGAYEAKTHLAALLDRVERGEALTITRNGRPVARLVPAGPDPADAIRAAEELRRARVGLRLDGADWRAWRDEGRR